MKTIRRPGTSLPGATVFFILAATLAHAATPLAGRVIALDPGHGTIDYQGHLINSGKSSRDGKTWEYRITFEIAQKLGKMIEDAGGRVVYTRTPFDYWRQAATAPDDNRARALLANELKADVFLAIHCDWDPRSRISGVTTYYKTQQSRRLGKEIHSRLINKLGALDRRLQHDSFTVLDQTTMPTVLIETGFLSNRSEAKKLSDAEYQKKVAGAILAGLDGYFSK
jgi:N-acetylmuramoyl-L-alanine amidase